jgi:hypothetical protein
MEPASRKMQFSRKTFSASPKETLRFGLASKGVACRFSLTVGSASSLSAE